MLRTVCSVQLTAEEKSNSDRLTDVTAGVFEDRAVCELIHTFTHWHHVERAQGIYPPSVRPVRAVGCSHRNPKSARRPTDPWLFPSLSPSTSRTRL